MRGRSIAIAVIGAAMALSVLAQAAPFPPVDQKRPPIVLKTHGIFWAGGRIVSRTQSGSENAGDLKGIPFAEQQFLAGQAYVEYSYRKSCAAAGARFRSFSFPAAGSSAFIS